ncbi:MAG: outer membrane protein transport protein [Kofleriaceae bacterium]
MRARITLAVLGGIATTASPAHAGGQLVGDNGAQGQQRAGAFTAKADDPTALAWNPAGVVGAARALYLGANIVQLTASYTRDGAYAAVAPGPTGQPSYTGDRYPAVRHAGGPQAVPMLAATIPLGRRLGLGLGVMAPHGYGRRHFPLTMPDGAPAPQRYDTVDQQALVILPSLALAADLGHGVRVGVRASYGYAALTTRKVVQGIANGAEDPAQDSEVTVTARDAGVPAVGVGLAYRAAPQLELAATWQSAITLDARGTSTALLGAALREPQPGVTNYNEPVPDGQARCAPGGTRDALATCATIPALPQVATVAARYLVRDPDGAPLGDVEVDVRWEQWSRATDYRIVVDGQNHLLGSRLNDTVVRHGLVDTWSIRLGLEGLIDRRRPTTVARRGRAADVAGALWHLRGGLAYDTAAAPPSWTRLDLDGLERFTAAAGVGVELGRWRIDVGGALVVSPSRHLGDVAVADPADAAHRVQPDIGVPLAAPDDQPYNPFNAGTYASGYWIGSAGVTRGF